MEIKRRLEDFRREINVTQREFATLAGINPDSYKKYDNPSFDKLEAILNAYPNLSAEWLMRGEGSMFKTDTPTNVNNFDLSSVSDNAIKVTGDNNNVNTKDDALQKVLEMQQQLINYLTTDKA